jgi:hypothetical protein
VYNLCHVRFVVNRDSGRMLNTLAFSSYVLIDYVWNAYGEYCRMKCHGHNELEMNSERCDSNVRECGGTVG